jgi:predicted RNA-binding protein YlqC (UPF0109 family)
MHPEPDPAKIISYLYAIIGPLCARPESLQVTHSNDERGMLITLYIERPDLGRVIGKGGETANAARTLLRSFGYTREQRCSLKIEDMDNLREPA